MSQKYGRRKIGILSLGIIFIITIPALYGLVTFGAAKELLQVLLISFLMGALVNSLYAWLYPYITERFKTSIRATGYGVAYNGGLILSGLIPYFVLFLHGTVFQGLDFPSNAWFTVSSLIMLGCVIGIIGLLKGPETKDINLSKVK